MAITRMMAIKRFFNMDASAAMREIKELKEADANGYQWVAEQCAVQLGEELKPA